MTKFLDFICMLKTFFIINKDFLSVIISALSLYISIKMMRRAIESDERTVNLINENKIKDKIENMPIVLANLDFEKNYNIDNYTHFVENEGVFDEVKIYLENTGSAIAKDIKVNMYFADKNKQKIIEKPNTSEGVFGVLSEPLYYYEVELANNKSDYNKNIIYEEKKYLSYYDTNINFSHHLLDPNSGKCRKNIDLEKAFSLYVSQLFKQIKQSSVDLNISDLSFMNLVINISYKDIFGEEYSINQNIVTHPYLSYTNEDKNKIRKITLVLSISCNEVSIESKYLSNLKEANSKNDKKDSK